MNDYLSEVFGLLQTYGYTFLFLGVMLESVFLIGIIFPGIFIMIAGGFFAGIGELNIYYTLLIAFLGMLLGDNISFFLGRLEIIKMNRIKSILKGKINIDKIINNSKGNLFIMFYHFPVYARMVVPTILGNLNYSLKKWILLNTIGTLIFTVTFILIGYFVGLQSKSIESAISISSYIQLGFLIIFSIFIVLGILSFLKIFKKK
ncbi:DedA family protein [Polaribacter porphyrae]|uniref:VTT domain-containing protein n=1 Tax=Polaribacter porphyrae TaxID=1137780 RepID=A0A2S7WSR1_9FLAO|nr:VTT domain-containing protein [Polaribacter porphyrae]PQJ80623.1 hypothetical protein BTO18_16210 [Polaribacter porphyrae]